MVCSSWRSRPQCGAGGRAQLYLHYRVGGGVDMWACRPCARAVLERMRVNKDFRRTGCGGVLSRGLPRPGASVAMVLVIPRREQVGKSTGF
ncbi:hypothetical protein Atai01_02920 [Amycolatopsis taiwanensis]|uniref:Uncharacterized protein n=1 Tax=Amycolatopsis taiwanensis TaxID=342230 RepID=A0A9W6QWG2_9PSEU|nr:hypothetical protein Atai01_02920 [Amycolatopsis taiwanensis]